KNIANPSLLKPLSCKIGPKSRCFYPVGQINNEKQIGKKRNEDVNKLQVTIANRTSLRAKFSKGYYCQCICHEDKNEIPYIFRIFRWIFLSRKPSCYGIYKDKNGAEQ